jgi:hypothetical protein
MTNSHPAKVNSGVRNVLSSGIDSLVLALYVDWPDSALFIYLDECKERAKATGIDNHGQIKSIIPGEAWPFTIKPHGSKGFSWILSGADFTYTIANSVSPGTRPSVMLSIRSEALWRMGPEEAIKVALSIVEANRGNVIVAKLSRLDLCLDVLMPKDRWSLDLANYIVTRAVNIDPHLQKTTFTGLSIGRGELLARLYDKVLEINQKSKKYWMFDIWGITEVPEDKIIVRFEFQMRRQALKELGLDKVDDLFPKCGGAWAYCTKDWLKFQDRPGLHHNQRTTFDWYTEIQSGFDGAQGAEPLVRQKADGATKKKLLQQINGCAVSLHAIRLEEQGADRNQPAEIDDCILAIAAEVEINRRAIPDIQEKLAIKRAKYHREAPLHDGGSSG